jgi:5'-3' exonuclease
VFVVSNDKDMMQLVNERVKILNPAKDNLVLRSREGDGDAGRSAGESRRM